MAGGFSLGHERKVTVSGTPDSPLALGCLVCDGAATEVGESPPRPSRNPQVTEAVKKTGFAGSVAAKSRAGAAAANGCCGTIDA